MFRYYINLPTSQIAKLLPLEKSLSLGLFRSDYMLHQNISESTGKSYIKQVEFNTIASSFGGLASKVCSLHKSAAIPELLTKLTRAAFSTRLMHIRQSPLLPLIPPHFPQTHPSPPYLRVSHSVTEHMVLQNRRQSYPSAFFSWCKPLSKTSSTK